VCKRTEITRTKASTAGGRRRGAERRRKRKRKREGGNHRKAEEGKASLVVCQSDCMLLSQYYSFPSIVYIMSSYSNLLTNKNKQRTRI